MNLIKIYQRIEMNLVFVYIVVLRPLANLESLRKKNRILLNISLLVMARLK